MIPPNTAKFPPSVGATQQGYFYVDTPNKAGTYDRSGPYYCRRIPVGGQLPITKDGTPQMVLIDERAYFPPASGAKAKSIVTEVRTGTRFSIVHTARWPDEIEAYLVRVSPS